MVGSVAVGSAHPVVVQSMTDTPTADVDKTVAQIIELAAAGAEMVRITINDEKAAQAVDKITNRLAQQNQTLPLIGDFHYNGHKLLKKYPHCAELLAKWRINPGNVGKGTKHDKQFAAIIEHACRFDKPIRIGVNWGSLDQDLLAQRMDDNQQAARTKPLSELTEEVLVESAISSADYAQSIGLGHDRIIISCKLSHVAGIIRVYRRLAALCDYPLHIGLTEAGMGRRATVASSVGLGILLAEGIGDTVRVSLTPRPGAERAEEVRVAQEVLQVLNLRSFSPTVVACPGCGRTTSDYFRHLAQDIESYIKVRMPVWRQTYHGVEDLNVAVMGCVVNGPGESRNANIGISLPGAGERPVAPVYIDGEKTVTLKGATIGADFKQLLEQYVASNYGKGKDEAVV